MDKNVFQAIQSRRSVRSYSGRQLDRRTVQMLLHAAVWAPTAIHEEAWAFVVVQDSSLLKALSDRAKPIFAEQMQRAGTGRTGHSFEHLTSPDFNIFYDANTLIVICAKPVSPFVSADCWLAAENLMLAACAEGLGTCVIGSALSELNSAESKAELGIPEDYTAVAPIIVGYPNGATPVSIRREPVVLAWHSVVDQC